MSDGRWIRKLRVFEQASVRREAVDTLMAAFWDDPFLRTVLPHGDAMYDKILRGLFSGMLRLCPSTSYIGGTGNSVCVAAVWGHSTWWQKVIEPVVILSSIWWHAGFRGLRIAVEMYGGLVPLLENSK
eukprot:Sspe_Gene.116369::Locus_105507_Transcript_1_1_Confidence_1.000_Length_436::g.116369::m.116369